MVVVSMRESEIIACSVVLQNSEMTQISAYTILEVLSKFKKSVASRKNKSLIQKSIDTILDKHKILNMKVYKKK